MYALPFHLQPVHAQDTQRSLERATRTTVAHRECHQHSGPAVRPVIKPTLEFHCHLLFITKEVRGGGSSCGRLWRCSCRVVCCVVLVVCLCV